MENDSEGVVSVGTKVQGQIMLRIANTAVYESIAEAKAAGLSIPVLIDGVIKFELPDSTISDTSPDSGGVQPE